MRPVRSVRVVNCLAVVGLVAIVARAAWCQPLAAGQPRGLAECDFVFIISVDGLRPDAITAGGSQRFPNLARLAGSAATLNARTEPDYTTTLPNHISMITGRPVEGPHGHGWRGNSDPPRGVTIHSNAGREIASIFDVAHAHGVRSAVFFGKTKFFLWVTSYNADHRPDDAAIARVGMCERVDEVTDGALQALADWDRGLVFLHYALTDLIGHAKGWDVSAESDYMLAVGEVDAQLGRLLASIDAHESHAERTGIILTSDHGGGWPRTTHINATKAINYTIPFLVWTGDRGGRVDLYALNAGTRRDPGASQPACAPPDFGAARRLQPIRNGDAANLAMSLLGLPAVPGSTINATQDLRVPSPAHTDALP